MSKLLKMAEKITKSDKNKDIEDESFSMQAVKKASTARKQMDIEDKPKLKRKKAKVMEIPDHHRMSNRNDQGQGELMPVHGCEDNFDHHQHMILYGVRPSVGLHYQENLEGLPNPEAQQFYDLLHASRQPLWHGCQDHSELSVAMRMLSIKSKLNQSQYAFNQWVSFMREILSQPNLVPDDFYKVRKLISKLGLKYKKIDCCINGCMLYYKDDAYERECKFCNSSRYKPSRRDRGKEVPVTRMHYLPLIPRLQRLYASMSSASHMRWHYENRQTKGVLSHPSDGEAWKFFDRIYPDFARDPRNIRLGLCVDRFTPYNQSAAPYSCWSVIVTPYNLPPELCMTTPYMFLTCLVPGPNNPNVKIDVYLQPLMDELKQLWWQGVLTYDISTKENFMMRAALMWTINDFPTYGMLSGWSTTGKLACPICMEESKAFTLKHSSKNSWFDSHRRFLLPDHPFRQNKTSFRRNKVESDEPPTRLMGEKIWARVSGLPKITERGSLGRLDGFGVSHNWTKQSIFWELPYWKHNLIRHNLDVMHIEKKIFDNVFNTVMDMKGKTKDTDKARLDLKEYCMRQELELTELANCKFAKPKATYTLTLQQRKAIHKWVKELRMPDGYASNFIKYVDKWDEKFVCMKSHDCHVFLECLLPIAFRALPDNVWKPLTELSQFFRDMCSTKLKVDDLLAMQHNIPVILCKLERIFPPAFFDSMVHLSVHLAYEARVGGPVQYRWMYPFKRIIDDIKRTVKNKAQVEGSICEAYITRETSHFCSYYFKPHVQSGKIRVGGHDDGGPSSSEWTSSIFNQPGRASGIAKTRWLNEAEYKSAALHVLLKCDEVQPYLNLFLQVSGVPIEQSDRLIQEHFASWFQSYVHDPTNGINDPNLHALAWGPSKDTKTWPKFFVNGYKFHTASWSEGEKTCNSGVWVRGTSANGNNDHYGILKDVLELDYPGLPTKKVVLFYCEWFDPTRLQGTRVHTEFKIVEVEQSRRYERFDPFIVAQQARQVYYVPYPSPHQDRNHNWWVVIKTKARGKVKIDNEIELPYQVDAPQQVRIVLADETMAGSLHDGDEGFEQVEIQETSRRVQPVEEEVEYASSSESTEELDLSDAHDTEEEDEASNDIEEEEDEEAFD